MAKAQKKTSSKKTTKKTAKAEYTAEQVGILQRMEDLAGELTAMELGKVGERQTKLAETVGKLFVKANTAEDREAAKAEKAKARREKLLAQKAKLEAKLAELDG